MFTRLGIVCLLIGSPSIAGGLDAVVKTESGLVAGAGTSIRSYKGIPYAAPPVGELRWKDPQPAKPWKGIRPGNRYGNICPQLPLIPDPQSEDCLTLNVWTPAKSANAKLPVMVWVHGGGFQIGASAQTVYDGEALAAQGVVLVSINYRLGMFGFFAHPALSAESTRGVSGNQGLLDMVAALGWVKRNIAAFGGNPDNVTIFGESAGGTAVCLLMVMPDAKGLFQKVIAESAAWMDNPISHLRESWYGRIPAEKYGEKFGSDLAALRKAPVSELMKKVGMPISGDNTAADRGEAFMPNVDGVVLPDDPARLFAAGKVHPVALIAGTNADEGTLLGGPPVRNLESYAKWAARQFSSASDKILSTYPAVSDAEAHAASAKVNGEWLFLTGTRSVLRAAAKANPNTYQYFFTRINGVGRKIQWGAFHASELGYVFGNLPDSAYGMTATLFGDFAVAEDSYTDADQKLSTAMSTAWVRFAKTGDPNGPGLPKWPRFADGESYLEFGDRIAAGKALRKTQLDLLSEYSTALRERAVSTR